MRTTSGNVRTWRGIGPPRELLECSRKVLLRHGLGGGGYTAAVFVVIADDTGKRVPGSWFTPGISQGNVLY